MKEANLYFLFLTSASNKRHAPHRRRNRGKGGQGGRGAGGPGSPQYCRLPRCSVYYIRPSQKWKWFLRLCSRRSGLKVTNIPPRAFFLPTVCHLNNPPFLSRSVHCLALQSWEVFPDGSVYQCSLILVTTSLHKHTYSHIPHYYVIAVVCNFQSSQNFYTYQPHSQPSEMRLETRLGMRLGTRMGMRSRTRLRMRSGMRLETHDPHLVFRIHQRTPYFTHPNVNMLSLIQTF